MALEKVWTRVLGGPADDQAYSVTTTSDGSIYIAGYTNDNLDGQTNSGSADAFISKYNSNGTKIWTRLLGGSSYDLAGSVTAASDGSIYIAGELGKRQGGGYYTDAFVRKYNSAGVQAWTKTLTTSGSSKAKSIATASDGSIYLAGAAGGNLDGQTYSGSGDAFLCKFSSDGTKVWTRLLGTTASDEAFSVTTANDGSIYIAGGTNGSLEGQINKGFLDAFITKFNNDGTKSWTKQLGTPGEDYAYSVNTASDGSIYIAGYTHGNLDGQTNNGFDDAFITKFSSDGTKAWTKLLGGSGYESANSVTTSGDGSI